MKNLVVTCRRNADSDGFACLLAYADLKSCDYYYERLQAEARFLRDLFKIRRPRIKKWRYFALVDASSKIGIPAFVNPFKVVEVVDHRELGRKTARNDFPNAAIKIERVGACATLFVEEYASREKVPELEIANSLYVAIYSNTLNLKARVTTKRDVNALKWLRRNCEIIKGIKDVAFSWKKCWTLQNLE